MYHPHSSIKKAKTRCYELIVTEYPSGALAAKLEEENVDPDNLNPANGPLGSPNGRTSAHGFFTSLGLAIGERFKKG